MKNEAKERFRYPHIGRAVGDLISVSKLYTVHFFVNEKDYPTPGELHDFWEMIYMDDGRMEVYAELDDESFVLEKGELLIIRPDEYHEFFVRGDRPYNMFIISFASDSEDMRCFFQKNRFVSYEYIQQLIGEILREARRNFSYPLDKICFDQIRLKEDAQGDYLQKIRLTLELLLLQLRREALKKLQNEQTRSRTLRGDGLCGQGCGFFGGARAPALPHAGRMHACWAKRGAASTAFWQNDGQDGDGVLPVFTHFQSQILYPPAGDDHFRNRGGAWFQLGAPLFLLLQADGGHAAHPIRHDAQGHDRRGRGRN